MKIPDFTIMIPFTKIKDWYNNRGKPKLDAEKTVADAIAELVRKNRIKYDRQCDANAVEIAKSKGYDKIENIDDPVK